MEPIVKNTPMYVTVKNSTGAQIGYTSLEIDNLKDDGLFERTGEKFFSIYLNEQSPSDNYAIIFQFGPDHEILGKQMKKISFSNNESSIGNQLKEKYTLSVLERGTNWKLYDSTASSSANILVENNWSRNCERQSFECPSFISIGYKFQNSNYNFELKKFNTEKEAQKHASLHFEWDGRPSSAGNKFLVSHHYEDVREKCFDFAGGYYSANGPKGVYHCAFGTFAVKSTINDTNSRDIIHAILLKIESNYEPESKISTLEVEPEPEPEPVSELSEGGGCLIATTAYGSELAPQVQFLRELRDNTVLQTTSGTAFMTGFNQFYYSFSPAIADYERENPVFKETVKVTLTPLLTSLTLLNYVDIDTEEEMLGYGIGIILLNIGMYFVTPAVLIISLKKRLFL